MCLFERRRNMKPDPALKPYRVLIIEDVPERQEILKSLYRNQAWVLVHTARRAITLLSAFEFDIISLDYNLAGELDGAAVARALMASENAGSRLVVHSQNPRGADEIR